jgi:hypothetical protein
MKRHLILLVLAFGLLAACGPQSESAGDQAAIQTWLDTPADGSLLPEAVHTIVFSGAAIESNVDSFELMVNGALESEVDAKYQGNQGNVHYGFGTYDWLPPAPGNYLIQVRTVSGDLAGAYAYANVVVGELVSDNLQVAELPPADSSLVAIPEQNVNCREGNSNAFDIADTLFEAMEYSPLGRGFDNLWVLFNGPATGASCWVFVDNLVMVLDGVETAIVEIPEARLPFVGYPATPTPEPTATFTPEPTAAPQCSDGIDNDGDGRIDFAPSGIAGSTGDRECDSPSDNDESR